MCYGSSAGLDSAKDVLIKSSRTCVQEHTTFSTEPDKRNKVRIIMADKANS